MTEHTKLTVGYYDGSGKDTINGVGGKVNEN